MKTVLEIDDLVPAQAQRIGDLCEQFERDWREGRAPLIERVLADEVEPLRSVLFRHLFALELDYLQRRGIVPTGQTCQARFPEFVAIVARVLAGRSETCEPRSAPPNVIEPAGDHCFDPTLTFSVATNSGRIEPFVQSEAHRRLSDIFQGGEEVDGRYVLREDLGRGGMGQVFLAHDKRLDRLIALKVSVLLTAGQDEVGAADDDELRKRFLQESQIGASLVHPAIATVHDFGLYRGVPYAVFEYLSGETLRRRMKKGGKIPLEDVRLIIASLAQGLDFAHSHHVVHRDLKPENIRADEHGNFKILDFGLARVFRGHLDWSGFAGTPAYASPEQAAGLSCDGRADQYALALIVYEMLTGRRVFIAGDAASLLNMHRSTVPEIPDDAGPAAVRSALVKALAKDPQERFMSCQQFATALGCRFIQSAGLHEESLRETTGLKTFAAWCLKIPGYPLPQPHPMTMLAIFSPGHFWYALLVLDSRALWINYRDTIHCYPLERISRVWTVRCGHVLRIAVRRFQERLETVTLYFDTREQALAWRDLLSAATRPERDETEIRCEFRREPILLLTERAPEKLLILGVVEASHRKRWVAKASLQIQASRMGADAIVDLKDERLPGMNATTTRLSGTAVQIVEREGLRALWLRGFVAETTRTLQWSLALALMLLGVLLTPLGSWELKGALSNPLQHFTVSIGVVCLSESCPVLFSLILRLTRWPQFSIPAAIAFVVSSLPFAVLAPVALLLMNPIPLAVASLKLALAHRTYQNYRRLQMLLPEPARKPSAFRSAVVGLTSVTVVLSWVCFATRYFFLPLIPDQPSNFIEKPGQGIPPPTDRMRRAGNDAISPGYDAAVAVEALKKLLEAQGLNRREFPEGRFDPMSFDPEQYDPAFLEAVWEHVRKPVVHLLNTCLNANLSTEDSLRLSVAPLDPQATSTRYQIVFLEQDPAVQKVLKEALSLPSACLPSIRTVNESTATPSVALAAIFRNGFEVDWDRVAEATAATLAASDWQGEFTLGSGEAKLGLRRVEVGTSWQEFQETKTGVFVARLVCEVTESNEEGYLATARIRVDIGRRTRGPDASAEPQIVGANGDGPGRYDDLLVVRFSDGSGTSLRERTFPRNRIFLDDGDKEPVEVRRPLEASRLLVRIRGLADSLRATLAER